jgi:2-polyprenyl-3-methyl-5-hydroxy-6-metoxy-1,4-benzoquinol methylase
MPDAYAVFPTAATVPNAWAFGFKAFAVMEPTKKYCPVCKGVLQPNRVVAPALDTYRGECFSYGACPSCGILVLQDAPESPAQVDYSASGYYQKKTVRGKALFSKVIALYVDYLIRVTRLAVEDRTLKGKNILDIGCGKGRFLVRAREHGASVEGIEPTVRSFEEARTTLGDAVHNKIMTKNQFPAESFDIVTMWHVFEHVSQPLTMLEACFDVLKPKGKLLIAVPNYKGWIASLGGHLWFNLDPPRHEVHYDPSSLTMLLKRCGFHLTKVNYFYPELTFLSALQTLLNKLPITANFLFNFLKRNAKGLPKSSLLYSKDLLLTVVFGSVLALPVFVAVPLLSLFRKSDCITVVAEKA